MLGSAVARRSGRRCRAARAGAARPRGSRRARCRRRSRARRDRAPARSAGASPRVRHAHQVGEHAAVLDARERLHAVVGERGIALAVRGVAAPRSGRSGRSSPGTRRPRAGRSRARARASPSAATSPTHSWPSANGPRCGKKPRRQEAVDVAARDRERAHERLAVAAEARLRDVVPLELARADAGELSHASTASQRAAPRGKRSFRTRLRCASAAQAAPPASREAPRCAGSSRPVGAAHEVIGLGRAHARRERAARAAARASRGAQQELVESATPWPDSAAASASADVVVGDARAAARAPATPAARSHARHASGVCVTWISVCRARSRGLAQRRIARGERGAADREEVEIDERLGVQALPRPACRSGSRRRPGRAGSRRSAASPRPRRRRPGCARSKSGRCGTSQLSLNDSSARDAQRRARRARARPAPPRAARARRRPPRGSARPPR